MKKLTIEECATQAEKKWGIRPICILACAGGADQHWQIFHPCHREFPVWVLVEGLLEVHPDGPIPFRD